MLSSIFIPKSLTTINQSAFYNCPIIHFSIDPANQIYKFDNLSMFTGSDNSTLFKVVTNYSGIYTVPNFVTKISGYCFNNVNISSINFHDRIESIGEYAFSYCQYLISITIPKMITAIDNNLFIRCQLLENVTIPTSVIEIRDYAFYACKKLTTIAVPNNVKYIGRYAFYECSSLLYFIMPENLTSFGVSAFGNCKSLISVTFSDKVTNVTKYGFLSCGKINSISFPSKVTRIEESSFSSCSSLSRIIFPKDLAYIERYAFGLCVSLKSITFLSNNNTIMIEIGAFSTLTNPVNIHIPGNFYITTPIRNAFPARSHLYITNETNLSESCKNFFGEKSVIVHFVGTNNITNETTIDVINYIAIEIRYRITRGKNIFRKYKLLNIAIFLCVIKH